jgi:hypothetical protein
MSGKVIYGFLLLFNIIYLFFVLIFLFPIFKSFVSLIYSVYFYFFIFDIIIIGFNFFILVFDRFSKKINKKYLLLFCNLPFIIIFSTGPFSPIYRFFRIFFNASYAIFTISVVLTICCWWLLLNLIVRDRG